MCLQKMKNAIPDRKEKSTRLIRSGSQRIFKYFLNVIFNARFHRSLCTYSLTVQYFCSRAKKKNKKFHFASRLNGLHINNQLSAKLFRLYVKCVEFTTLTEFYSSVLKLVQILRTNPASTATHDVVYVHN